MDVRQTDREARIPITEEKQTKMNKQFKRNRILTIILRFKIINYIDYILYMYCISYKYIFIILAYLDLLFYWVVFFIPLTISAEFKGQTAELEHAKIFWVVTNAFARDLTSILMEIRHLGAWTTAPTPTAGTDSVFLWKVDINAYAAPATWTCTTTIRSLALTIVKTMNVVTPVHVSQ